MKETKTNKIILEINNLNFYINNKKILKNINLQLKRNKIYSLLGYSNSGKSLLLKCINNFDEFIENSKLEGAIRIYEENNIRNTNKYNCYILEKPYVLPCSILKNIYYNLTLKDKSEKNYLLMQVERYLKEVELWDEVKGNLNLNAEELNFYQQQKLCLARGLALKPSIILADNPTLFFDYDSTLEFEKLFLKLKKNYTIIIIPRNISQARRISDEIIYLHNGEIIEQGPTSKLLIDPQTEEFRKFLYINC